MAAEYFSDNDVYTSHKPLPSPSGTPYHSLSRRTSRYGTPSSEVPNSPVPFPPEPNPEHENEKISVLDPRRFTPTLHASLVTEILNLKRDLESKDQCIEDLEMTIQEVRDENTSLNSQLVSSAKETRAAKRQLQQLENGTISALEEMVGERDKTEETNADLKQKLEAMQKKVKGQEEDSSRVHDMWAQEKEAWAREKQALERRVHISESRLKLLLDELVKHEAVQDEGGSDSEGGETLRDSGVGHDSDTGSARSSPQRRCSTQLARHSRNLSNGSYRSIGRAYRMSLMSLSGFNPNGKSLADELAFDEEEEELEELETDSDDFPENEFRARRALESRQSMQPDEKAKRILGLSLENQTFNNDAPPTVSDCDSPRSIGTARASRMVRPQEIHLIWPPLKPEYVDRGYQPSPPPSPVRPDTAGSAASVTSVKFDEKVTVIEVEANQSRKRRSVPDQLDSFTVATSTSSTQTQPLSPPETPKVVPLAPEAPETPDLAVSKTEVVSVSTQTEPIAEPEPEPPIAIPAKSPLRVTSPTPITIPSIAIHAPSSLPPSPQEPLLPPGTKNVGTQTGGDLHAEMHSVGTQTDPIRIDKRLIKLPPHLQPSSITSRPNTPEVKRTRIVEDLTSPESVQAKSHLKGKDKVTDGSVRQDLTALLDRASEQKFEDRYPGNNDNGPLSVHNDSILSRPFRTSSLFAGFEGPSSDEEDIGELSEAELNRSLYAGAMLSSRNVKSGRVFHNPPTPVPEEKEVIGSRTSEQFDTSANTLLGANGSGKDGRHALVRQPSIRRSSGVQRHMRARSPSQSSGSSYGVQKPPFPVPTRSSSRVAPFSKSEGSQSPTPRSSATFSGRRPYGNNHQRKESVRKVRSAAAVQKSRSRSRSPPLPVTPVMPLSPDLPPLPIDMITGHRVGHQPQLSRLSTNTSMHSAARSASVDSAADQANIVDAIAATMVGEWMWKYTRKRKAFGTPEPTSPADLGRAGEEMMAGGGVRHKRWVWISPYERSILWSSKQPTTQSALVVGKSGRKLTIQSVLDVPDNTPVPKGAGTQLFNRSILILTPARALKFTASSRERHYLWLTALSFLAHSGAPIPELAPFPPAPPQMEDTSHKPVGATLRRSHVRDSVRLAKGRANPASKRHAAKLEPVPDLTLEEPDDEDFADYPTIPRGPYHGHGHGRKRSSTGPEAPPPSVPFRSFSSQAVPSVFSSHSNSSDKYNMQPTHSGPSSLHKPQSGPTSTRTSEASNATRQQFFDFDAMGTVRMEAFIDNSLNGGERPGALSPGPRIGQRRGSSRSDTPSGHRLGGFYDEFTLNAGDPFRGF